LELEEVNWALVAGSEKLSREVDEALARYAAIDYNVEARAREEAAGIPAEPVSLDAIRADAERFAEAAGVDLAAMLATRQGKRPTPDGVARQLFVVRWRERGASLGQLKTVLGLGKNSNRAVLELEEKGLEERARRANERLGRLADYLAHSDGRPTIEHDDSPAAKRDRLTQSVELRRQAAERNPAEG
jgi:hypothetical protein